MASAATLAIFRHLFASVAEEMGITLERTGYSPNIKERLDFSCAVFLGDGRMVAQADHMPVHLGAMPASVEAALTHCAPFQAGDVVIVNDPYQGGNHLPDITLVSPVFLQKENSQPDFFVASRAHHADVGGMSPGSMPLSSELFQEGIIIPPLKLVEAGQRNHALWTLILRNVRTPAEREGDLAAQLAAHAIGERRLHEIVTRYGTTETMAHARALIDYAQKLTEAAVEMIPNGRYTFTDFLDNDGQTHQFIPIKVTLDISDTHIHADFTGTAPPVQGNLNTVPAVVQSAFAYCVRCVALALLEVDLPMNHGAFEPLSLTVPENSLLNPRPPHAVAAGNVETSQRITDVIFGALAGALPQLIPSASQGTMNNLTFGGRTANGESFAYYETMGGGTGANAFASGASGVHSHMSNTLNTPIEALEYQFPLRVTEYSLRYGSGGGGQQQGGDGLVRQIQFLTPVTTTILSERRERAPYAHQGGQTGQRGQNSLVHIEGSQTLLPSKTTQYLQAGDTIRLETPGGGGWGDSKTTPV